MFASIVSPLRKLIQALVANGLPGQLAAGFTLGMIVGLMPKGNLIALSLCVLLFSLRLNKGLAIVAMLLFSWIGPAADSWTHKLGVIALGIEPLQANYASVFNLPLGPWLGLNNTVVVGSLLLGLYAAYPVFWLSRAMFTWLRAKKTGTMQIGAKLTDAMQGTAI